jgi:hypothetical protein
MTTQQFEKNEEEKRLEKLNLDYPKNQFADLLLDNACVITREGFEIQFFDCQKNAGAWMQHVYGVAPTEGKKIGLEIKSIKNRGPKDGDLIIYLNDGKFYHKGIGCLEHIYWKDKLCVCFSASSFRIENCVSCSGGPVPFVNPNDLTFDGLRRNQFWRWGNGFAGGGEAGYYYIDTPSWRWNGNE